MKVEDAVPLSKKPERDIQSLLPLGRSNSPKIDLPRKPGVLHRGFFAGASKRYGIGSLGLRSSWATRRTRAPVCASSQGKAESGIVPRCCGPMVIIALHRSRRVFIGHHSPIAQTICVFVEQRTQHHEGAVARGQRLLGVDAHTAGAGIGAHTSSAPGLAKGWLVPVQRG